MSQYFDWVNYTKRQFLQLEIFPEGLGYMESCFVGAVATDAASTLLAGPWRGDLVTFAGEYAFDLGDDVTPASHPGLRRFLDSAMSSYDIEYEFADVTGRFTYARGKLALVPAIGEDGHEFLTEVPYEGPFDLEIAHFRFMVNETKGLYYDREAMQVRPDGWRFDPLPLLLGTGRGGLLVGGEHIVPPEGSAYRYGPDGLWVGDLVYPTCNRPGSYKDVSALYTRSL